MCCYPADCSKQTGAPRDLTLEREMLEKSLTLLSSAYYSKQRASRNLLTLG